MKLTSALYIGSVMHRRTQPRVHCFRYRTQTEWRCPGGIRLRLKHIVMGTHERTAAT